ncbi:MAG: hypothetical protein WB392_11315 [Methanotrichaceae archaeon]
MSGLMRIDGKVLTIQEAAKKLNNMGLVTGDFSEAMYVFNLEFPFVVAIMSGDGCESSIRVSSQEITKSEAI